MILHNNASLVIPVEKFPLINFPEIWESLKRTVPRDFRPPFFHNSNQPGPLTFSPSYSNFGIEKTNSAQYHSSQDYASKLKNVALY